MSWVIYALWNDWLKYIGDAGMQRRTNFFLHLNFRFIFWLQYIKSLTDSKKLFNCLFLTQTVSVHKFDKPNSAWMMLEYYITYLWWLLINQSSDHIQYQYDVVDIQAEWLIVPYSISNKKGQNRPHAIKSLLSLPYTVQYTRTHSQREQRELFCCSRTKRICGGGFFRGFSPKLLRF